MANLDRAVLFIDGNNLYHGLRSIGMSDLGRLDFKAISEKLVGPARDWIGTRYYIGRVNQSEEPKLYASQRSFAASFQARDSRHSIYFGRLETRSVESAAAKELAEYLQALAIRIEQSVYTDLIALAKKHRKASVKVEKAVDVMIATDMVAMAARDEYDAAYLLSADGDLTPAVSFVRDSGRKVYVAAPGPASQLRQVANTLIPLRESWFADCWAGSRA
jgi:uncharacterized LabA/DUF88 family protein